MEPNLTAHQAIALMVTIPLVVFVVVNALDKVRDPQVRWGRIKSTLYLALIGSGMSSSGVFVYSLLKIQDCMTPLFVYSISVSVLSTYLYSCKNLTALLALYAARKKAPVKTPHQG